jgi:predicted ABC-type ATPase
VAHFKIVRAAAPDVRPDRFAYEPAEVAAVMGAEFTEAVPAQKAAYTLTLRKAAPGKGTAHRPAGDKRGGQFMPKNGGGASPVASKPKGKGKPAAGGGGGGAAGGDAPGGKTGGRQGPPSATAKPKVPNLKPVAATPDKDGHITFTDGAGKSHRLPVGGSLDKHLVVDEKGNVMLSPERQKLHSDIVASFVEGVPRMKNPKMYMTGGGPAAGKSTMLEGGGIKVPLTAEPGKQAKRQAVLIDPDAIKKQIPEYAQMTKDKNLTAAAFSHEESSMLSKRIQQAAIDRKHSVVLDTTGDSDIEKLSKQIEAYRSKGFEINAYYASNDPSLALKLSNARGDKTGRYVPEHIVKEVHANVSRTLPKALGRGLFDNVSVYDTNVKGEARLVVSGSREGFKVHDRDLWNDFLGKGESVYATASKSETRQRAGEPGPVSTHDAERMAADIMNGIEKEKSVVSMTPANEFFWDTVAEQVANAPEGAQMDIGKEYPDLDYSTMYDDATWTPPAGFKDVSMVESRDEFGDLDNEPDYTDPSTAVPGGINSITGVDDGEGEGEKPAFGKAKKEDAATAERSALHPGASEETVSKFVTVKRMDMEKQIVYGEVYAPNALDTYGEFMTAEDIEVMAHRFMQLDLSGVIDTQHDQNPNGAYPVESFIARENDPDYVAGAWVLGVKCPGDVWQRVKSGELNGFSFQCLVKPISVAVESLTIRDHVGATELFDDHNHTFFVSVDESGNVTGGVTSKAADGHFHEISKASITDGPHHHRFFI